MMQKWIVCGLSLALGLLAFQNVRADGPWIVDFEKAKDIAKKEGKPILMEFTGSDWCPPCKSLKKNVFSKELFQTVAPKKFVLLKLDYPRNKKNQTKDEIAQNKQLSKDYNLRGYPTVLLVDAEGQPFAKKVGYGGEKAKAYMEWLLSRAELGDKLNKFLAKAEKAEGLKKAKLLFQAIRGLDTEIVMAEHKDILEQVVALDPENKGKVKAKAKAFLRTGRITKALEKIRSNPDAAEAVDMIEELIQKEKLKGKLLQEALYMKAIALFRDDRDASKATLERALEIAPDTETGARIRSILDRFFKEKKQ